jgi:hypothetical protein
MNTMLLKTKIEDLPPELAEGLGKTDMIIRSYLAGVQFIVQDTARDPNYGGNHLLSYLAQDLLQSAISIVSLAMEGLISVAKRELRFVVESSIKICFVQQHSYTSTVQEKVEKFDKELSSQRISIKQDLALAMLPEDMREKFGEEVGRVYGLTSEYVHLTPRQILERIAAVEDGQTVGKEPAADIEALNELVSRGLACALVMLFHSVPEYVTGDWLVESDGATTNWYFMESRFLAAMDSHFDYKHERQASLDTLPTARQARIRF